MSVEMRSKNHSGPVYGRNGACSANAGSLCRLEQAKDSTKVEEPELHVATSKGRVAWALSLTLVLASTRKVTEAQKRQLNVRSSCNSDC